MGKPKAAVFPVPVCAKAIKSFFDFNINVIAFSWTGEGSKNPKSERLFIISEFRPSSLNVVIKIIKLDLPPKNNNDSRFQDFIVILKTNPNYYIFFIFCQEIQFTTSY